MNLFGFVGNDGINNIDLLGLFDETGANSSHPCIKFSWDMPAIVELYGSSEFSRLLNDVGKAFAKLANKRIGSTYDLIVKGMEEASDMYSSTEIQYQITIIGRFSCNCCCTDDTGLVTTYSGEWAKAHIITPADFDETLDGSGWSKSVPFPAAVDLQNMINITRRDMYIKNWKECKSNCGK